jgi:membrane fusion protein (multidrug efflux system)
MKSAVITAGLKLSSTVIRAPFDGIIDRIPQKIGSLVDEGTLLTTLSDNREVFAYFNVSEKEYLNYTLTGNHSAKKEKVTLILANNTQHPYPGTVETIEGEFHAETGSIAFRARFPNPKGVLRQGSSGRIRLQRNIENALVIPQKSTFEIQDKIYVYVMDSTNHVNMRNVNIKMRLPQLYVVRDGLSTKDLIVYEGIQDLTSGDAIEPQEVDLQHMLSRSVTQNNF